MSSIMMTDTQWVTVGDDPTPWDCCDAVCEFAGAHVVLERVRTDETIKWAAHWAMQAIIGSNTTIALEHMTSKAEKTGQAIMITGTLTKVKLAPFDCQRHDVARDQITVDITSVEHR